MEAAVPSVTPGEQLASEADRASKMLSKMAVWSIVRPEFEVEVSAFDAPRDGIEIVVAADSGRRYRWHSMLNK